MIVTRTDNDVQISCTADELAAVLADLWGHSMGMCEPGRDLTHQARTAGILVGMVNR